MFLRRCRRRMRREVLGEGSDCIYINRHQGMFCTKLRMEFWWYDITYYDNDGFKSYVQLYRRFMYR